MKLAFSLPQEAVRTSYCLINNLWLLPSCAASPLCCTDMYTSTLAGVYTHRKTHSDWHIHTHTQRDWSTLKLVLFAAHTHDHDQRDFVINLSSMNKTYLAWALASSIEMLSYLCICEYETVLPLHFVTLLRKPLKLLFGVQSRCSLCTDWLQL